MKLGAQYYRPPFPRQPQWVDDLKRMKDAGLDHLQLWLVWGWIEAEPGHFRFEDCDRLVDLAGKHGLEVVLSVVAEVQPMWIHRIEAECHLIDHHGRPVVSAPRSETHFGLTPGGCFDHPGVWQRMEHFIGTCAHRYVEAKPVVAWDAWNELRWHTGATAPVCYCRHTLAAFRAWLVERYGTLTKLNAAWERRYADWADVEPGRFTGRPCTEHLAFQEFLTWRAGRHAAARVARIKVDITDRPVVLHGGDPSVQFASSAVEQPLCRGDDFTLADDADGIGCSSFPAWEAMDDLDFVARVRGVRAAAGNKQAWLSALQGGNASSGFQFSKPVEAAQQQRWLWLALAAMHAERALFWSWRDEIFGLESGGFGLIGADGKAEERLAALRQTRALFDRHRAMLAEYRPDPASIGLLFSPRTWQLMWSLEGSADRGRDALRGWTRACTRLGLPARCVHEDRLEGLDDLQLLILPHVLVVDKPLEDALVRYVERGGTLVVESECGAFTSLGLYREGDERFTNRRFGLREGGRRAAPTEPIVVSLDGGELRLQARQWLTTWERGQVAAYVDGEGVITGREVKQGKVVALGSHFATADAHGHRSDFDQLMRLLALGAGIEPRARLTSRSGEAPPILLTGSSNDRPTILLSAPAATGPVTVELAGPTDQFTDLFTGRIIPVQHDGGRHTLLVTPQQWGMAFLIGGKSETGRRKAAPVAKR